MYRPSVLQIVFGSALECDVNGEDADGDGEHVASAHGRGGEGRGGREQ